MEPPQRVKDVQPAENLASPVRGLLGWKEMLISFCAMLFPVWSLIYGRAFWRAVDYFVDDFANAGSLDVQPSGRILEEESKTLRSLNELIDISTWVVASLVYFAGIYLGLHLLLTRYRLTRWVGVWSLIASGAAALLGRFWA